MSWKKIIYWFKDYSMRAKFINVFNENAKANFSNLSINALLIAKTCMGSSESYYRHEMSAPVFVSGFCIEVIAGEKVSQDDIMYIGRVILYNERITRWLWALHWATLVVKDMRTGIYFQWAIKDFINLGGLLGTSRNFSESNNNSSVIL